MVKTMARSDVSRPGGKIACIMTKSCPYGARAAGPIVKIVDALKKWPARKIDNRRGDENCGLLKKLSTVGQDSWPDDRNSRRAEKIAGAKYATGVLVKVVSTGQG